MNKFYGSNSQRALVFVNSRRNASSRPNSFTEKTSPMTMEAVSKVDGFRINRSAFELLQSLPEGKYVPLRRHKRNHESDRIFYNFPLPNAIGLIPDALITKPCYPGGIKDDDEPIIEDCPPPCPYKCPVCPPKKEKLEKPENKKPTSEKKEKECPSKENLFPQLVKSNSKKTLIESEFNFSAGAHLFNARRKEARLERAL